MRVPLSFSQERMWFLRQLFPTSAAYVQHLGLRMRGPLDVNALERALAEVMRRHEALRTTFGVGPDGLPEQRLTERGSVPLVSADLSHLGAEDADAEARRRFGDELERPFRLETDLPFRSLLFRLEPDLHVLLVLTDHIVADGWSLGIIASELAALYEAYAAAQEPTLEPPALQYPEFALWQRRQLTDETLEESLSYWQQELRDLVPLELPLDRPRPRVPTADGDVLLLNYPRELSEAAVALARSERATPFMLLLAVFAVLLSAESGTDDIAVGVPVHGRRSDLESVVGSFVNSLVLRFDLSGDPSFREVLARVRAKALSAYLHQDVPFERVVRALHPPRDLQRNPFFDVFFGFQNLHWWTSFRMGEVEVESYNPPNVVCRFDVELHLWLDDGSIGGGLLYQTASFDRSSIERLGARYGAILAAVTQDSDVPLSALAGAPSA